MNKIPFLVLAVTAFCFLTCKEPVYNPKPRTYPKVNYPERAYQAFKKSECAFTFEYPTYAQITQNEGITQAKNTPDCIFDLFIPAFDSRLHCTYYQINSQNEFAELWNDAFDLANKHNVRAEYIEENKIQNAKGVGGFAFDIKGPAASPFQFFLTDSTQHFLRASLYFNTQVRQDSMAPVYDFVIEDLMKIVESFEWKEAGK
ncbi:MAG: hypothetical protein AAGG68_27975 [Bacteroidota bacterium]